MISKAYAGIGMPLQGTDIAVSLDLLYDFLVILSAAFFVGVVGAMIYFAVKYHHKVVKKTKYLLGSHELEAVFVAIPTILLLGIFVWGYVIYSKMANAPGDAYEIRVVGKQWSWDFQYDNGKVTTGELYAPLNRAVKLVMTSQDVLHSFFVPNFRIKQDVVPGMYTSVWFEAKVPGKHQVYCTEYCGTAHSGMLAQLIVLTDDQWTRWLRGADVGPIPVAGTPPTALGAPILTTQAGAVAVAAAPNGLTGAAANGKKLATSRGCVACHSDNGDSRVGPTWKGIYGTMRPLVVGGEVLADDKYLRDSILKPNDQLLKGFSPSMPTFAGQIQETEINDITAYIKYLGKM